MDPFQVKREGNALPESDVLDRLRGSRPHVNSDSARGLVCLSKTAVVQTESLHCLACVCDTSERLHRVNSFLLYLGMTGMCQPRTEIASRVELLQSFLR